MFFRFLFIVRKYLSSSTELKRLLNNFPLLEIVIDSYFSSSLLSPVNYFKFSLGKDVDRNPHGFEFVFINKIKGIKYHLKSIHFSYKNCRKIKHMKFTLSHLRNILSLSN